MRLFTPTQSRRLNEVMGFLFLASGILVLLSFASFHPTDPSLNTVTDRVHSENLIGPIGAYLADIFLQSFGLAAFLFPVLIFGLGWKWIRSEEVSAPLIRLFGSALLLLSACGAAALLPEWRLFEHTILPGGAAGFLVAGFLRQGLNVAGAGVVLATSLIVSTYLVSTFTLAALDGFVARFFGPVLQFFAGVRDRWNRWKEHRREVALEKREARASAQAEPKRRVAASEPDPVAESGGEFSPPIVPEPMPTQRTRGRRQPEIVSETMPWDEPLAAAEAESEAEAPEAEGTEVRTGEIPICRLDELPPPPSNVLDFPFSKTVKRDIHPKLPTIYRLPSTELLNEIPVRSAFDEQELKTTAAVIKSKLEEFNVFGSIVQINPGPVVTTFEFKPEAGIKYTKVTTLTEDLCLGLQAESILIERIPGKPTIGIEVPNTKRELISLRAVLESEEFESSPSHMTISMGKDINGRIKVAALETMPHLLIAGSTGSGKSVMINSLIMSILYKSTPDEVRMIMVDPKRVELGMYEGVPHLLTPVITDPRKATNALRNAVLEMERRLRLLAEQGARNIDQYNKKVRQMRGQPLSLFEDKEEAAPAEELQPLPYILILIDELADLMILEGRNVEESVTRLAQMARAVGMHLVLATQRPSVDVITGIIKANFPARISFRVATRVDSRTILDVMGSEHLLGKGDMLFLPPGSSRLTRVHGAFVTETEIIKVVDYWKAQAKPEYDQSFLLAPPSEDGEVEIEDSTSGEQDPMYEEAMRVVLEMGKASTSTLQRRLRLGYGRAARILDTMYRDGVIGPPDGSKPREVLKRPDWLREVDHV
ncbi:MAG: segregation ATPase FtsK/SpoIIIE, family [Bryobacterales bacterium]|jgi:S-DNA-T family DNA segregation ATPase FtsK/SpoIIIE|nr:segregation ATPase FtsK/SpoIIIE, family [Bryobacterales bacterium]